MLRLRFILVTLITAIGIVSYLAFAFTKPSIYAVSKTVAVLYLVSFGFLGVLAAYRVERFTRQLFLRERQLDEERNRSDGLLLNTFPEAIVDQLKTTSGGRIAQRFDEVSVMFVDAVGSTAQAARSSPEAFTDALDDLFRRFDRLVERHGLEKIETIGDAYVAVAGAPIRWPIARRHPPRWRSTSWPKRGRRGGRRAIRSSFASGSRRGPRWRSDRGPTVRVRPVG